MTRQRSDEQRKQQIRSAATRCFVRHGFAATRLLDIAKEAGLSKGGVYFHYRAKEHLFQDILDTHLRSLQSRWSFVPTDDQPADRTLTRLLVAHLRTVEDDPDETRLCNLLVAMAPQEPALQARLREVFDVMHDLYAGVIDRGIREGAFMRGDPRDLGRIVLALVYGMGCCSVVDAAGRLPARAEEIAERVLRMLHAHRVSEPYERAQNLTPAMPS